MAETPTRQLQQPQAFITNKMPVNSVDHGSEESRTDFSNQEMDIQIQHRGIQKVKSVEGFTKPKKGSFMITRVVTKQTGDGEDHSMDDHELDETNTEDLSSDLLDVSKTTDIEPDMSSEDTVHSLAQEELLKEALQSSAIMNQAHAHGQPGPQSHTLPAPSVSDTPQPEVPVGLKDKANDSQSRFKVVKIESKEPFKRGRWRCHDFLDPPTSEKPGDKVPEKVVEEVGSGNSSAASSVHYVPGVDDPSKNPLVGNMGHSEGHQILEPKPIHPLQNGDLYATQGGAGVAVGQVASMGSVHIPNAQMGAGQGGQSNIVQSQPPVTESSSGPGGQVMQTSLPTTQASQQSLNSQAVPMTQNVISTQANISSQHGLDVAGVQQQYTQPQAIPLETHNGHVVQVTQSQSVPSSVSSQQAGMQAISSASMQTQSQQQQQQQAQHNLLPTHQGEQTHGQQQDFISQPADFPSHASTPQPQQTIPQSQREQADFSINVSTSQAPTNNPSQPSITAVASDLSSQAHVTSSTNGSPNNDTNKQNKEFATQERGYASSLQHVDDKQQQQQQQQQQPVQHRNEHSTESREMLAIKHMSQTLLSPPLLEMVSATMQPNNSLMNQKDDDDSNASTVAIDNKIEQAMDLVKSHLMFAVREEVEVLKEQIKELTEKNNHLLDKNNQLEYENNILKGAAAPETLAELQTGVVTQPPTSTS